METVNIDDIAVLSQLNESVENIDTSFPVLVAGLKELKITKAEVLPTKENDGHRLTITFATVNPDKTVNGDDVAPGYPLTYHIGVTEKATKNGGQRTAKEIKRDVALLVKGVGLTGTVASFIQDPQQFIGRQVTAKVKVRKEDENFDASNQIGTFITVA